MISYGSSGQTPLWKRLVNGSSNYNAFKKKSVSEIKCHLKPWFYCILQAIFTFFFRNHVFHFKPSGYQFSLCKFRAGLLYFQNMVVIFSKYTIFVISSQTCVYHRNQQFGNQFSGDRCRNRDTVARFGGPGNSEPDLLGSAGNASSRAEQTLGSPRRGPG